MATKTPTPFDLKTGRGGPLASGFPSARAGVWCRSPEVSLRRPEGRRGLTKTGILT